MDFIFQERIFSQNLCLVRRNQFKLTSLVKGLTKAEGRIDRRGRSIKGDVSTSSVIAFFSEINEIFCKNASG